MLDLVTIAPGEVDVRAVRLHPCPPSLVSGFPPLFVGLDGKRFVGLDRKLLLRSEQDAVGVIVPGECEQHLPVRADEVRVPVRLAVAVESDDDVPVWLCPCDRELDLPCPEPRGRLQHFQRSSEEAIGSLHDPNDSSDREPERVILRGGL